jgi:hypothetical protein
MVSGWELGRHMTSTGYRAMLREIFQQPSGVLFAHQDAGLASGPAAPRLLAGFGDLQEAMLATVAGARECLVVMGSRSRDPGYLGRLRPRWRGARRWCSTGCCSGRRIIRC